VRAPRARSRSSIAALNRFAPEVTTSGGFIGLHYITDRRRSDTMAAVSDAVAALDLSGYREIVVLTGAGVSVASGLPTYRGVGGLWEATDVAGHATAAAIAADPRKVWAFFAQLRRGISGAAPNPAHLALARAERALRAGQRLTVITQNVDGLHHAAGSSRVVELHGTLLRSRCTSCEYARPEDPATVPLECPPCPSCGAPLRPDVVLFDEALPVGAEWDAKMALRECDLFVAVGTSGSVSPASNFVRSAEYAGARTLYVNLEPMHPPNPAFREVHLGPAEDLLPRLFAGPPK
jgi:NAD-dependent deacetylase